MKTRVAIYIDGSNLYHKLKGLGIRRTSEFNYRGLCDFLLGDRRLVVCCYYVGVVRAKMDDFTSQVKRSNQQKFFSNLKSQGIEVKKGYLLESNGVFHEKSVDVQMAVDLLSDAFDDIYDVAILISSDTDIIPAIKKIKKLLKTLEYVGFYHAPSFGLKKHATIARILTKEDLESF